jgi:hypothetical protein
MTVLIKKCPKCRHVRRPEETTEPERCPACGLYFEKWAKRDIAVAECKHAITEKNTEPSAWRAALVERLSAVPGRGDMTQFYTRAVMLTLFLIWGICLARMDYRVGEIGGSFMHAILLPIHEAGHILFIPFGHFMTILGGSLFQLLLPLIAAGAVLWQNRDPFGAALGVWWCGVSLMDLAPYIYDAKEPRLILLGGHTGEDGPHDWIYLLDVFHKVERSQAYGAVAHKLGIIVMLAAIAAAGIVLRKMWKARNEQVSIGDAIDT